MRALPIAAFTVPFRAVLKAAILAALTMAWSHALPQVQSGTTLPNALKDIKPASGVCTRDGNDPGSWSAGNSLTAKTPDLSCAIGSTELKSMIGRADTALVDVRTPTDFELRRIDGTFNATVTQLRSKSFLQAKSVVLIGDGRAERELYAACADLKAAGFKRVRVLQGGLPMWLARGLPVVGRGAAEDRIPRLSASELWMESQFDANLVLVVSSQATLQGQLPFAQVVPDGSATAVKAVIAQRRKALHNLPLAAVVLVASPDVSEDALQQTRKAIDPAALLIYAGGLETFSRQIKQQETIWATHVRGPKQPACGR